MPAQNAAPLPAADHHVRFYEQESFLAEEVADYFARGLGTGHSGLLIGRPSLASAVLHRLSVDGLAQESERLLVLDAQQTLDAFMVEGWPDATLFHRTVDPLVDGASRGGRMVWAYGEMVALLCEQGHFDAAVRLEELWNAQRSVQPFSLLCAYPMRLFAEPGAGAAFRHLCAAHGQVRPTERAAPAASAEHALDLARLQQQNLALAHAMDEREKLLSQLRSANGAKDEFLAMLGHELRNPLAPILTALDLMKLRGDTATEREQALIRRQLEHLLRLVDDLLDVSRITRGKLELQKQPCKVEEVLTRAVEMATPLIERRRHRLAVELPDAQLHCAGDGARLAQMVANLLVNAARYTEPGGRIVLGATQEGRSLHLTVADTGIGIAPEMLESIFELFRQPKQGVERPQGGLGIGLALVRSLAHLHGGHAWAESAGPGRGSTFHVRLPDASVPVPVPQPPREAQAAPALRARVLIVDDNREAADSMSELLRAYGCEIRTAYDPAQALRLLDGFTPEIAILDIGLPVMDGYELAVRMREHPTGKACRLFALTGYGQQGDRERSAAAGFEQHLVKPVDTAHLTALISATAALKPR